MLKDIALTTCNLVHFGKPATIRHSKTGSELRTAHIPYKKLAHNICQQILCLRADMSPMIRKQDDIVGSMFHNIAHLIQLRIDETLKPYDLTRLRWLAIRILSQNEGLT